MRKSKSASHHRVQRTQQYSNSFGRNVFLNKETIITLIRFYAGHECLWNQYHEQYYDRTLKNNLWSWIAKQLRATKPQVEFQMRIMHNQALKEFERLQAYLRLGVLFEPRFEFLNEFHFLLEEEEKPQLTKSTSSYKSIPSSIIPEVKTSETKETNSELGVFCDGLKQELIKFPYPLRMRTQEKLLHIIKAAQAELAIKPKPILYKKFGHRRPR